MTTPHQAQSHTWPDEVVTQPAGSEPRLDPVSVMPSLVDLSEASLPSVPSVSRYLDESGEFPASSNGEWQSDWIEDA